LLFYFCWYSAAAGGDILVGAGSPLATWPKSATRYADSGGIRTVENFREKKGETGMKPSTKDELKGKLHELKGDVREKAGQVTNNPNLEAEGKDEKLAGKVQKKVGQVEKVLEK
jgi:uncharacterized protein YjbJ (UPF0337 family)